MTPFTIALQEFVPSIGRLAGVNRQAWRCICGFNMAATDDEFDGDYEDGITESELVALSMDPEFWK
jgi:hypothetical protein